MPGRIEVHTEKQDGRTLVTVAGILDEDSNLVRDLKGLSGEVHICLKGVTGINSCGVRAWVNAVRELEKTCRLTYLDVSVPMIQQFNMIGNARGRGSVLSFYAPYFCPACEKAVELRLSLQEHGDCLSDPSALLPPQFNCDACGGTLEFDDIPEKYFHFLENQLKTGDR